MFNINYWFNGRDLVILLRLECMSNNVCLLTDLFQLLLGHHRYTATKPKLLVKMHFYHLCWITQYKKKELCNHWTCWLIGIKRGGCFTSLFACALTSWPGIRRKKEKKNSISVKHFNIKCLSGLLYIFASWKKNWREGYQGERKRRGRSEKGVCWHPLSVSEPR